MPAVPPSPTITYPIEIGSKLYFLTRGAPSICAPMRKYGSTEFRRDMNHMASAWRLIPVMLFGKRIVGILTVRLMALTTLSRCVCETKVEPPIITAEVPLILEFSATREACGGVILSGSTRVMWTEPSALIFSSKYFSTRPSMFNPLLPKPFLCLPQRPFLKGYKRCRGACGTRQLRLGQA